MPAETTEMLLDAIATSRGAVRSLTSALDTLRDMKPAPGFSEELYLMALEKIEETIEYIKTIDPYR